jgi:hypothetical protein
LVPSARRVVAGGAVGGDLQVGDGGLEVVHGGGKRLGGVVAFDLLGCRDHERCSIACRLQSQMCSVCTNTLVI